jgi:hypothetical protein
MLGLGKATCHHIFLKKQEELADTSPIAVDDASPVVADDASPDISKWFFESETHFQPLSDQKHAKKKKHPRNHNKPIYSL